MNLFCFSLEGSMDSLYEAVQQSCEAQVYTIPSRSCSPAVLLDDNTKWRSAGRSISMEISQINTDNNKKKIRRSLPKSVSENEALDNTVCTNSIWQAAKKQEDSVLLRNNQNKDLVRALRRVESQTVADRQTQTISRNTQKEPPVQIVYNDGCNPNQDRPSSSQNAVTEAANAEMAQTRGMRVKKFERKSSHRGTPIQETAAHIKVASGIMPVLDVGAQPHTQENTTPFVESRVMEAAPANRQRWSNPIWVPAYNACQPHPIEYRIHTCDCTTSRPPSQGDKINVHTMKRDPSPKGVVCSTTNVDFCASNRSTSFGRFDTFRHQHSPSRLEENGTAETDAESTAQNCEKPGSLGKKMKAISMTMCKRMGKKHVKSFLEDMGDDTEGEIENGSTVEKNSDQTSNSLESLCSAQSSSSSGGVARNSDGSSNRDSLKLEEAVPYTGQFCGRARVHTDFVPSPYDTDSLKLKVGDIISIVSKPPMGIWTGMLNGKVGNFKFIYVDVLPEKEEEEKEAPKIRPVKVCRKPRPNTLLELLERLHLEQYASSLLLNGYQTVDDLKHLKERHLIELNVIDPDHRCRLLAASECLYVTSRDEQGEIKGDEEEDEDCLRDSGCFIPAECPDS
ncbi:SAM domain-containing protein SAMSN-1a [Myxocyprinus asiaticus]|uniref:SAM domain-containing protein SAMSN-1a n=1 Tax=Myxocyprinus asiaticus TaxID=70543 RepID=UPI0022235A34|nr:SAM domain-containing protein SAMSN-1a [Myxocyprinus asiaticus]